MPKRARSTPIAIQPTNAPRRVARKRVAGAALATMIGVSGLTACTTPDDSDERLVGRVSEAIQGDTRAQRGTAIRAENVTFVDLREGRKTSAEMRGFRIRLSDGRCLLLVNRTGSPLVSPADGNPDLPLKSPDFTFRYDPDFRASWPPHAWRSNPGCLPAVSDDLAALTPADLVR